MFIRVPRDKETHVALRKVRRIGKEAGRQPNGKAGRRPPLNLPLGFSTEI